MKSKVAIWLLILFVSVGFRDVFTVVYFYGNQSYIIENFCVNKVQPQKQCNGKCYLADQLEDDQSNEKQIPLGTLVDHYELKILPTEPQLHNSFLNYLKPRSALRNLIVSRYHADSQDLVKPPPRMI